MAINFNQLFVGQPIRTSVAGESSSSSGRSNNETAPVGETEDVSKGGRVAHVLGVAGPENGLQAIAMKEVDPAVVPRAVKQANALAETALRAQNRSVEFSFREDTNRVTMTIREEVNGEEVIRHIPPKQFLDLVEKLQSLAETTDGPRGTLLSIDG
jgi:hypothetical protein